MEQSENIAFADEYMADGWTGMDFARTDFEWIMAGAKSGAVNRKRYR